MILTGEIMAEQIIVSETEIIVEIAPSALKHGKID